MMGFDTVTLDVADHVATITLDRPEVLNAFNQRMCDELEVIWSRLRTDDDVRAIVLQAAGERAFCTGVDIHEGIDKPGNPWVRRDPSAQLGPKTNGVWKPVVCALHGLVAGGALYFVNEADIVIGADDLALFDPHVDGGRVAALEPIGLRYRLPFGAVVRMALLGGDERMDAATALRLGLISEVVPLDELRPRARQLALAVAAKPPLAVQGTLRALWQSLDLSRSQALSVGLLYPLLGNPLGRAQANEDQS